MVGACNDRWMGGRRRDDRNGDGRARRRAQHGCYDAGGLGVSVSVLVSILALGLIPATSQWWILRPNAPTWASFSVRFVVGLAIGGTAGWVAATALGLTLPSGPAWIVVGAVVGAATGATTARPVLRAEAASVSG
jgi:hypothetical protein